jgi:hypothetical protein
MSLDALDHQGLLDLLARVSLTIQQIGLLVDALETTWDTPEGRDRWRGSLSSLNQQQRNNLALVLETLDVCGDVDRSPAQAA